MQTPKTTKPPRVEWPTPSPAGTATDPSAPLLIEGILEGNTVEVTHTDGATWIYTAGDLNAAACTVLVHIEPAEPAQANMFRPGPEGIHPYIRRIQRIGVNAAPKGGAL